jgi:hypothetical protein
MQNKPNFMDDQMNVSSFITIDYEQRTMNYQIKNKPNTKPIQTQYKANTNPIQTQYKPKQTQFQRQKNAAFRLFTVGYLRKKLYSIAVYIGNIILFSRLMAKEKLK